MASKRNRILDNLVQYLNSLGIEVNIGKNKAGGNNGFFKAKESGYRIDIAKGLSDENIIGTLSHEFAHFIHYTYDKSLKSLDFIFDDTESLMEEFIAVTVESIPKGSIKPLFDKKNLLQTEISELVERLSYIEPKYNIKNIEKKILKSPYKYLLKYDRVKIIDGFTDKIYSIEDLRNNSMEEVYIKLKSKQRALKRINARISRLNKYYNSLTELFARTFELYVTKPELLKVIAPRIYMHYSGIIEHNKIPQLTCFYNFLGENVNHDFIFSKI